MGERERIEGSEDCGVGGRGGMKKKRKINRDKAGSREGSRRKGQIKRNTATKSVEEVQ